jgi:hypothetical protein
MALTQNIAPAELECTIDFPTVEAAKMSAHWMAAAAELERSEHPRGFFRRQFSSIPTIAQKKFDWTFGVGLPIVCIAADPIVFRSWGFREDGLLSGYTIFCYALSSVSILAMAAWLLWGNKLGELRPFLGGLFLVAAAISTLVGVVISPLSAFGILFYGLGLLGFVPLFSGFVFLRNAYRAVDSAADDLPLRYIVRAAMLAVIYSLIVPFVLNF